LGYRGGVLRAAGQYGLIALIGIVVMAWGTSPCLYVNLVRGLDHVEDYCCDCCGDPASETGEPRPDDCPSCQTFGNRHELPPVGEPVMLDAPAETFLPVPDPNGATTTQAPLAMIDMKVSEAPPRVAFCETVCLTR